MAKDSNYVQVPSSQSSCSDANNRGACWQRSVKRKYDDALLNWLQGKTEARKGSLSCETSRGTVPGSSHGQKASCSSRMMPLESVSTISEEEKLDKGFPRPFDSSDLCVFPQDPCLIAENEHFRSRGIMDDASLPDPAWSCNIQAGGRNDFSKKRVHVGMSSQKSLGADRVADSATEIEVFMLKEALKTERDTLHKLYVELEEERCASATAANEAMAMITRLQEEKAAVLMEARRYRRVTEEREIHNQEAFTLLKEALLNKEDDLLALQDQVEAYREMFIESGEGRGLSNYLEEDRDKEQLLFLEGQETTSSSCMGSKHKRYHWQNQIVKTGTSMLSTDDGHQELKCQDELLGTKCSNQPTHDGLRMNLAGYFDDFQGVYDGKQYKEASEEDYDIGERVPEDPPKQNHYFPEDTFWERQKFQEAEMGNLASANMQCEDHNLDMANGKRSQEHSLEDVSVSILARVNRLEERFEYLRQNQALEYQRLNLASQNDAVVTDDLEPEEIRRPGWESAPEALYNRQQRYYMKIEEKLKCSTSKRLMEDFVNGSHREPEEDLKCSTFERVRKDFENGNKKECSFESDGETGLQSKGFTSRGYQQMDMHKAIDRQQTSFTEIGDDAGEGVHDVYEVQYETKSSFVPRSDWVGQTDHGRHKNGTGNIDVLMLNTSQGSEKELVEGVMSVPCKQASLLDEPEDCDAEIDDKLSVEISSLDVKGVRTNVADEDVRQLKVRLQALEGERVFMKQAIDSLRKENVELKLLQEIAQQLRELKGDVRRTEKVEGSGQQDQLPLFSFFKGLLSFTGIQSLANIEENRFFCPFRESSKTSFSKQEQGGLIHLLNNSSETQSVCVTRERKVNLSNT